MSAVINDAVTLTQRSEWLLNGQLVLELCSVLGSNSSGAMIGYSVTTSARVCREAENGKTVLHCSFHPFESVVACAVAAGRISLLERPRNCTDVAIPFTFWKETVSETGAKYPVKCLEWNVSSALPALSRITACY